jgi:hypothetical protein
MFFWEELLHFFNLKNMISTHTKDFWEKFDPNPPDLEGNKILNARFLNIFQWEVYTYIYKGS